MVNCFACSKARNGEEMVGANCVYCARIAAAYIVARDSIDIESENWISHPSPILANYRCNEFGFIVNFEKKRMVGRVQANGYVSFGFNKKLYYAHRFALECYLGRVTTAEVISHKDDVKINNRRGNVMESSFSQNLREAHERKRRPIKRELGTILAICLDDGTRTNHDNTHKAGISLGIDSGSISKMLKGLYHSASSRNGKKYIFRRVPPSV